MVSSINFKPNQLYLQIIGNTLLTAVAFGIFFYISENIVTSSLLTFATIFSKITVSVMNRKILNNTSTAEDELQTSKKSISYISKIPKDLIANIASYCSLEEISNFSIAVRAQKNSIEHAIVQRARALGYSEKNAIAAKAYIEKFLLEIKLLCENKLIPSELIVYRKASFPKNKKINLESTIQNLKLLTTQQLFELLSNKNLFDCKYLITFLNNLTDQGVLVPDGEKRNLTPTYGDAIIFKERVRLLAKHGANLNERSVTHCAAYSGADDILQKSLEQGNDLQSDLLLNYAIQCSSQTDISAQKKTIRLILQHKRNIPVEKALDPTQEHILDLFLEEKAKGENSRAFIFGNSLPLAVQSARRESVNKLLLNGANPNVLDRFGNSVLSVSVSFGDIAIVKLLLDHKANVNLAGGQFGQTPLISAIHRQHILGLYGITFPKESYNEYYGMEFVELLLNRGADINAHDQSQRALLHHAIDQGCTKVFELLLKRGANAEQPGAAGFTPLILILQRASTLGPAKTNKLLEILFELRPEIKLRVNQADAQGYYPLHHAIRSGCDVRCLNLLIEAGASLDVQGPNGITPLMAALQRYCQGAGSNDIWLLIMTLLRRGANPNLRDHAGKTALGYVTEGYLTAILPYLKQYGATT